MPNHYVAIDVETANGSRGSICQIGLVAFTEAEISGEWSSLVNPQCDFDAFNIRIHGIGSAAVERAPTLPVLFDELSRRIDNVVMVSHSPFDYEALHQAFNRYALPVPKVEWLDSCEVARTCWPHFHKYDLATLCCELSIPLQHHDALSDARACGLLLASAIAQSGKGLDDWKNLASCARQPIAVNGPSPRRYSERIECLGNPHGPLAGHVWVCTGDFVTGEAKLARLAAVLGCDVKERFGKKATMLVVGTRDPAQFKGEVKSRKLRDAEAAIGEGRTVHIMNEREFLELVRYYQGSLQPAG